MGLFKNLKNLFKSIVDPEGSGGLFGGPEGKTLGEFTTLVRANFESEYEISTNFAPANIDRNYTDAKPYALAFFKEGRLVLTILYTKHNEDKSRRFVNAKRVCQDNGITCLNFFEHFPNEDTYVIDRIRDSL